MPRPYAIDPAHYIARFTALLEFGDETPKVAHDAARLVKRFRADWMNTGRRPAGICGACILLAARMNNFRRSVQEIVQVVKIAEQTVVKRLEEFKETGSSGLTVNQFRNDEHWLPEAVEAPPVVKDQEKKRIRSLKRKRKRRSQDPEDDDDDDAEGETEAPGINGTEGQDSSVREGSEVSTAAAETPTVNLNADLLRGVGLEEGDLNPPNDSANVQGGASAPPQKRPLFRLDDDDEEPDKEEETQAMDAMINAAEEREMVIDPALLEEKDDSAAPLEDETGAEIAEAVEAALHGPEGEAVTEEVEQEERTRRMVVEEDLLDDLDEDELDAFILSPEEVTMKTRVWVELNRDYLEKLAGELVNTDPGLNLVCLLFCLAKGLDEEEGVQSKKPPKPKVGFGFEPRWRRVVLDI